jgi:hypothetical protein
VGQSSVGGTLIAAAVVMLALGMTWIDNSGGGDGIATQPARRAAASSGDAAELEIPPSQPADPFAFGPSGETIGAEPRTARVIDPDTGAEVTITLPPGSTVIDSRVVALDSVPGTSIPATGGGSTPTSGSPSTNPPTTTT